MLRSVLVLVSCAVILSPAAAGEGGAGSSSAPAAPPATPPAVATPVPELPPGPAGLWKLVGDCNASYEKVNGYTCIFRKQECFEGVLKPVEIIGMKFRKPQSVHLAWQNGILRNRQVIYVAGGNDGKIVVYPGNLPAFRKVFRISPDSMEVARENRHSILEAGMGYLCVRLREQFEKSKAAGTLDAKYLGLETLEGRQTWHIMRTLEEGGRREWNIDVELLLPTHVATWDKDGKLIESYSYGDIKLNPELKDEEFDPEKAFF